MSDISEHDTDDEEQTITIPKDNPTMQEEATPAIDPEQSQLQQHDPEEPTDTVTDYLFATYKENPDDYADYEGDGNDIVEELKSQAASGSSQQVEADVPEWQKYLSQNVQSGKHTYTDPTDGTVYEWNEEKRAWFPMVDDNFIAMYQANYGFTESGEHKPDVNLENLQDKEAKAQQEKETQEKEKKDKEERKKDSASKRKKAQEWFDGFDDPKKNTNIYVSGLSTNTTEEEFLDLMCKCGIIMADDDGKLKVKMYKNPNGSLKGDARCCFLKYESVVLACDLLDGSTFKGNEIKVEQAVFELKGQFDATKKPKKKKQKKKKGKGQEKLLDWVDRPQKRNKFDRIVILQHMFDHREFERDPAEINNVKLDLKSECEKFGDVKKVLIFDRNPQGVCSVLFREPEDADKCIQALNGRYYGGQVINASTYDGVTNYQVQETEEEMERRLKEWENFISIDDDTDPITATTDNTNQPQTAANAAGNSAANADTIATNTQELNTSSSATSKIEYLED